MGFFQTLIKTLGKGFNFSLLSLAFYSNFLQMTCFLRAFFLNLSCVLILMLKIKLS